MIKCVSGIYYVLRFKSKFEKQTKALIKDYKDEGEDEEGCYDCSDDEDLTEL